MKFCFVIAISFVLLFDSAVFAKQKEITIKEIESSISAMENSLSNIENEVSKVASYQLIAEVPNLDLSFKTAEMIINKLDNQINIRKKKNVSKNCKEFLTVYNSDIMFSERINKINLKAYDKLVEKQAIKILSDEELTKQTISYLVKLSEIYGIKDPNSMRLSIDKFIPIFLGEGKYTIKYLVKINFKNSYGAYTGYKNYTIEYYSVQSHVTGFLAEEIDDTFVFCSKYGKK